MVGAALSCSRSSRLVASRRILNARTARSFSGNTRRCSGTQHGTPDVNRLWLPSEKSHTLAAPHACSSYRTLVGRFHAALTYYPAEPLCNLCHILVASSPSSCIAPRDFISFPVSTLKGCIGPSASSHLASGPRSPELLLAANKLPSHSPSYLAEAVRSSSSLSSITATTRLSISDVPDVQLPAFACAPTMSRKR